LGSSWNSFSAVDLVGADDRIAADADAGRLAQARAGGELPDGLVGQRAGPADEADRPRRVDVAGHDADLALARRDDARTFGPMRRDGLPVRNFFTRAMSSTGMPSVMATMTEMPRVGCFEDGVSRAGRRDEDHRGVGPRLADGLLHGVEQREAVLLGAALAGLDRADDVRAVLPALLGVERACLPGPERGGEWIYRRERS